MKPQPAIAKQERSRKSIIIAVTFQCIPLVAAAGCASIGASNQNLGADLLLWLAAGFWGFGYLYLGRTVRFIAALLIGPLFAMSSCSASFNGVAYDYEHPYTYQNDPNRYKTDIATANRASFQEALIISAAVLLLSVDAWRLAVLQNAQLDRDALPQPVEPPVPEATEPADNPARGPEQW